MQWTLEQIAAACGGKILQGDPKTPVCGFETDSRAQLEGKMFVPIVGERADGHLYVEKAFAAGAAASFTQKELFAPGPLVLVPDSVTALQQCAAAYRSQSKAVLVGITGSVGKTTTKEFVALALSAEKKVMKTLGNQNSQVGLPMTLFRLEPDTQAAVVEMGMSRFGEMARLAKAAKPNYAVMTNIGVSHIEYLLTQQNILQEKLHITDGFTDDSVLFLNADDPLLQPLLGTKPYRTVSFGLDGDWDYRGQDLVQNGDALDFVCVYPGGSCPVHVPVPGMHNVRNALAAIAVAHTVGIPCEKAAAALAQYQSAAMRQQLVEKAGVKIIDDTYNASPDSMRAALDILGTAKGRKLAVLADMFELGAYTRAGHEEVGAYAAKKNVEQLVCVGESAAYIADGYRQAGGKQAVLVKTNSEALEVLQKLLLPGDTLLVKGSRGMHTDEIVSNLLQSL